MGQTHAYLDFVFLNSVAASAEKKIDDDNQQNQAETAAAVVANAGTYVVSAAAK
jgi:hypothetical protein